MHSLLSLGPARPPRRTIAVAWCGVAGFAMGLVFFTELLDSSYRFGGDARAIPAIALVPGLLSALAAWIGSLAATPRTRTALTLGGALATSLLCAPLSYCALLVSFHVEGRAINAEPGGVVMVTLIGAFIAVPVGFVFGVVFAALVGCLELVDLRGGRGGAEVSVGVAGLGWALLGVALGGLELEFRPEHATHLQLYEALSVAGSALAVVSFVVYQLRQRVLRLARSGAIAGWAVVSPAELAMRADELEALPRVMPFGEADEVLARVGQGHGGPFRSGPTYVPVARV